MKKLYAIVIAAMLAIAVIGAACTPLHSDFKNISKEKKMTVTKTDESYGSDPLQVVTVSRNTAITSPQKLVIFIHGGGWTTGGRGSLEDEAAAWAADGWVVVNVSYRVGWLDGVLDDGRLMLDDVYTVLQKYRAKSYVDSDKVVVYGESVGGHLGTWLGAKYGAQVKAIVAISPVTSISGAIAAGQAEGAPDNVVVLGQKAQEFFGYSVGTTDAHRYMDRVQHAAVVISTDEWVNPDIHGRAFCTALGSRCHLFEYAGDLHAGKIIDAHPDLASTLRDWSNTQVG